MNTNDLKTKEVDAGVFGKATLTYSAKTEGIGISVTPSGDAITVTATCDAPSEIGMLKLTINCKFSDNCRIYANGFQSWTDSFEYPKNAKQYSPSPLMRKFLYGSLARATGISRSGDYCIYKSCHTAGRFYGFSYGYIRKNNEISLIGSLDDSTGYTIFDFDTTADKLTILVDLEGRTLETGENVLARIILINDEYDAAFDRYFAAAGIKCRPCPVRKGYTTWYNYYADIDSEVICRDLEALSDCRFKADVFQVDDGYQHAVGDWLKIRSDFYHVQNDINKDNSGNDSREQKTFDVKDGMRPIAEMIHAKGMLAGLWLAPFAVVATSEIFREHKDWLVKDKKGKPVKAGLNWGGFYALDIYNEEVRAHLKNVFDVILNTWGFDLVKLDFLYAAAMIPAHGKCRAKIMYDAMDFLRECVGDKLILGCGVPLMPAFGKVDYCRIGPDISLDWKKSDFDVREGVSTSHAIANSAFRRHLDGRAFGNDPDVFILRNPNNSLTFKQKTTLAEINKLFGSVLFMSDDVSEYNDLQMNALAHVFDGRRAQIKEVTLSDKNVLSIRYDYGNGEKKLDVAIYTGCINKGDEDFDLVGKESIIDVLLDDKKKEEKTPEDRQEAKKETPEKEKPVKKEAPAKERSAAQAPKTAQKKTAPKSKK